MLVGHKLFLSIVLIADINTAPAWFAPAFNQALTPIKQVLYKTYNMQCGNGLECPYEIVPFNDGTMPPVSDNLLQWCLITDVNHLQQGLPALRTTADISALTSQQATHYAVGYGLGKVNPLARRRKAIGRFIGSTAIV